MLKQFKNITNINEYLDLALFHRNNKEFDSAINIYIKLIALQPNKPDFYDELAQAQAQKGTFSEAIVNYEKALELGIKNKFWTYKNLGDALRQENQLDTAILYYQKAINVNPSNPHGYDALGQVQSLKKNFTEAINSYEKALELNISNPLWTYKNLGNALKEENKIEAAISTYKKALQIQPDNSLILAQLEQIENLVSVKSVAPKNETPVAKPLSNKTEINKANQEILFPKLDDKSFIEHLYKTLLGRKADTDGLTGNLEALKNNVPRRVILENILRTPEFLNKNNQSILEHLDNKQFLHAFWQLLLGRECNPTVEKNYLQHLENGLSRMHFIAEITKSGEFRDRIEKLNAIAEKESKKKSNVWIMGTDKYLSRSEWEEKLLEVFCLNYKSSLNNLYPKQENNNSELIKQYASVTNKPLVSIITSLYKGREFIECFLENITNQTIFNLSELIIIDANSPEKEFDIIKKYMLKFNNIRYIRTKKVIGIYEAWNIGVELARGEFLTNANLDDLRRIDCLELQAETLLKNKNIDLVYQDFYYSMSPNLPFEIIEKCGYKSQLPKNITQENMIKFNPPHNAPMWRKNLHKIVGLFNTSYRSAGDYELWMRALLKNCQFLKIEEPIVVYYNNPTGISTRVEGHGSTETKEIQAIYETLFKSSLFDLSNKEFMDLSRNEIGLTGNIKVIEESQESWQKKISLLDKCFTKKLQNSTQDKFYLPLKSISN